MRVGLITFGGDGGKSGISQYIIKLIEQFNILSHDMDFEVIVYEDEKSIFVPEGSKMGTHCYGSSLRNPVVNLGWHLRTIYLLRTSGRQCGPAG